MDRAVYLDIITQHLKTAYLLTDEKTAALIPVFVTTLRSHADRLAALAAAGDMEDLRRAGHAVKGALLNMGLTELAQTAQLIEQYGRDGDRSPDCMVLIDQLQHAVTLLCDNRQTGPSPS